MRYNRRDSQIKQYFEGILVPDCLLIFRKYRMTMPCKHRKIAVGLVLFAVNRKKNCLRCRVAESLRAHRIWMKEECEKLCCTEASGLVTDSHS